RRRSRWSIAWRERRLRTTRLVGAVGDQRAVPEPTGAVAFREIIRRRLPCHPVPPDPALVSFSPVQLWFWDGQQPTMSLGLGLGLGTAALVEPRG
ncbi:MAG TPA: hypothetical protein VI365_31330, partial [Trebonia sp.]